ncbi:MAG: HIT domain-containing protein [Phycisphaerae bacterium]
MPEFSKNVWAPWRMEYIEGLGEPDSGCFLCRYLAAAADDAKNHVLWRSPHSLVLLNRFPYTNGHLLIAPAQHVATLDKLPEEVLLELSARLRDAMRILDDALGPQGYNVGMNLGRCAGAGLPDHLHWHIVPRWSGDTNFVPVIGDVRVMPQSLERTAERCRAAMQRLGLGA